VFASQSEQWTWAGAGSHLGRIDRRPGSSSASSSPPTRGRGRSTALAIGSSGPHRYGYSAAGDAIRVENTFFRFLCGRDVDSQYHETIYHLTIVDFATELHNARYFLEALNKELERASHTRSVLVVATIQFERDAASGAASHDVLRGVASALRRHLSREQVVARSGDLEITVVSPDGSPEAVDSALRAAVHPLGSQTAHMRLGVASSQTGIDSSSLLAQSRANARPWADLDHSFA
jgi:GGDEF domain-containing protein